MNWKMILLGQLDLERVECRREDDELDGEDAFEGDELEEGALEGKLALPAREDEMAALGWLIGGLQASSRELAPEIAFIPEELAAKKSAKKLSGELRASY